MLPPPPASNLGVGILGYLRTHPWAANVTATTPKTVRPLPIHTLLKIMNGAEDILEVNYSSRVSYTPIRLSGVYS